MKPIDGNFLNELLNTKTGCGDSTAKTDGEFFGNSADYSRRNQVFELAARFGAGDENKSPGAGGEKETFWVSKSADGEKIGENLLRENFEFEEIDVQAYETLHGNFVISDEKQCAINTKAEKPCRAATGKQINLWRTSADGKKVSVTLPDATVKSLRDFRQERLIERRVTDIGDPQLRAQTEKDLRAAVTKTGQERADAFLGLRNTLENASPDGKKAAAVIKLIAGLPENKENPFAQMLLAKIELKEIYSGENVMFNPNDLTKIEQRINRAADLASGYDDATRQRDPKKAVSRSEAQTLNEEAARLADQFGKALDARFRTVLARFYAVDDAERNQYEAMPFPQMTTLPRLKDSPIASMSAAPKETLALEQYRCENPPSPDVQKELSEDPQKREWKTKQSTDGKGGVKTEAYQQFQIEGSLKSEGVQETTTYTNRDEKGGIVKKGYPYYRREPNTSRQTTEGEEINSGGTTRAFGTAGAVAFFDEINKWTPLMSNLYYDTSANKIATREKLEKAAFNADNFPVPPKPERIQQMKRDLLSYRYASQSDFQGVQLTMKRLEDLSHAFWKR